MKKGRRETLDMTTGSPAKVLLLFAVPMILSNLFQQFYNLIDSLIVGNYLGADALAAVGSAGTVTAVIVQLASGLALGASVVISQYFGAGKKERIRVCMTTISLFAVVLGAAVTAAAQMSAGGILVLMRTPPELMEDSVAYLTVYFWGSAAIFLYNAVTAVFIAMGDSRTPLYFLICAFFLNVAGDLFFIIGCSMGVRGGALATTLSQAACTALSFLVLERKMRRLGMTGAGRIFDRTEFVRMMRIAVPAALQQTVVSLGNACVQSVTNSFGPAVMAGCTAANKAVNLVSAIPLNWGNALSNYVGQNVGAGKPERIGQGVKASLLATGAVSLAMLPVTELLPGRLIGWFVEGGNAQEVIRVGASYLRVNGWFLTVFSGYMVIKSVFKGVGDMNWFVGLTLSSLGIRVLCAFFLTPVCGVSMLWWSVAIGWSVSTALTVLYYLSGRWRKYRVIV
ncbi:MAG: MATE family efflux transporter [Lachnospiraceae bacterium]